jgi:hypothetical protein
MRKIIFIIMCFILIACERKPLYIQGDIKLNVTVSVNTDINSLWDPSWKEQLIYEWDESKYGNIGYTSPDDVELVFFSNNDITSKQTISTHRRNTVDIDLNKSYDILIYNKTDNIRESYVGGRYYITTPSYIVENNSKISDKYIDIVQPGEIFSQSVKNIYLSDEDDDYEIIYENGKNVYVYNIDAVLYPVSYIYIIQFIIVNDDNSERIEAKDIENITISGISARKNLLTGKPEYTGLNQISTMDIKDSQERKDSLLFASRVTILDLLPESENSSWITQQNYLYYTIVDVNTFNYGTVNGTLDITRQLCDNPKGGVITVKILNSDLKKGGQTSSGFGIDINEWEKHIIDIDF